MEARPWPLSNGKHKGLETYSARFDFSNGLSATAVLLKAISAENLREVTLCLNDKGKKASGELVSDRVNRGEAVIAADLLFTGDCVPRRGAAAFAQLLAATGDRALGLESAQLIALARWARIKTGAASLRLEATGIRSQVIALVAAALEPGLFREVAVREGRNSLRYLLDEPVEYHDAPDLFCLGLLKEFDIEDLVQLSAPTTLQR